MGPPRYVELLAQRVETLPPRGRPIRLGVKAFFEEVSQGSRRSIVWRSRHLAQFMRIGRSKWPEALDRLLALSGKQAESVIAKYRDWLRKRPVNANTLKRLQAGGFRPLTMDLKKRGLLRWTFKHERTIKTEGRWYLHPSEFRDQMTEWLRVQRASFASPSTLKVHQCELHHLGVYLKTKGLSFLKLSYTDALGWVEHLRDSGLSPLAFNRRLRMAKRFYAWLCSKKLLSESPFETIQAARVPRRLPRVLTEREVARLIRASEPGRNRAILEVMYSSGCRIGDLCAMDLAKVSWDERTAKTVGKGGHETILYLNDSALRALRAYLPERADLLASFGRKPEALFLQRGGVRISRAAARTAIESAAKKAGLKQRIHPHLLRHSFATHLLNRGADLFSIMQFMGHKNIQSTVRYLQVATERLSIVHRRFHPRR